MYGRQKDEAEMGVMKPGRMKRTEASRIRNWPGKARDQACDAVLSLSASGA